MNGNPWMELSEGLAVLIVKARVLGLDSVEWGLKGLLDETLTAMEKARTAKEPETRDEGPESEG